MANLHGADAVKTTGFTFVTLHMVQEIRFSKLR